MRVRLPTGCAPGTQLSMVVVHTCLLNSRHHWVALDVLKEFEEMAKEENTNPFTETASKQQIATCQTNYHNWWFNRVANESMDAFSQKEDGQSVKVVTRKQ